MTKKTLLDSAYDRLQKAFSYPTPDKQATPVDMTELDKLADVIQKNDEQHKIVNNHLHTGLTTSINTAGTAAISNITGAGPAYPGYTYAMGNITNITTTGYVGGTMLAGGGYSGPTWQNPVSPNLVTYTHGGKEIMRVTNEGEVVWADGIKIDEAAEAFSKSVNMGTELRAGITEQVKRTMRDTVFEEVINIAKVKGSLTAEDLEYLLQAAKIMEKLKGGK